MTSQGLEQCTFAGGSIAIKTHPPIRTRVQHSNPVPNVSERSCDHRASQSVSASMGTLQASGPAALNDSKYSIYTAALGLCNNAVEY